MLLGGYKVVTPNNRRGRADYRGFRFHPTKLMIRRLFIRSRAWTTYGQKPLNRLPGVARAPSEMYSPKMRPAGFSHFTSGGDTHSALTEAITSR